MTQEREGKVVHRETVMGSRQQEEPALSKIRNAERMGADTGGDNLLGVRGHQLREKMEV